MPREISLEEIKKLELDMLIYIDEICRKNNIEYFLAGGTLLGAVRHKGFIPWDDDIDIGLRREEYNKLIKVLMKEKNERYKLLTHDIEKTYYNPYAKLVNTDTMMIEKNCKKVENLGIFIDIFAYDNLPNNGIVSRIIYMRKRYLKKLAEFWGFSKLETESRFKMVKKILKPIIKMVAEKMGIDKILEKYDSLNNYNNIETKYWMLNWPVYGMKHEIQRVECFRESVDCQFENHTVKIPKGYDEILTQLYGDYMTPPPEKEREPHHYGEKYWKKEEG